ncbi:hypothetical protein Poli38472_006942 [Pythium oligandrum]|uniref:FYVE-type domain-containing protein n=1 Tax=Pythium oligandrum TaxID=41045 RepID=A0A8K1CAA7_PYTOL|nr:hypothetical protein Poli38472_006942 [Pythium oligandrum]|eukprot:TMW58797.1 hypothetical protein Poli38472_006942 [Pythium oligandrum]
MDLDDLDVGGDAQRMQQLQFAAARRQQFDEVCDDLIQRALEEHHDFHSATDIDWRWKLVRQRDALSVYRDRTPVELLDADVRASSRSAMMLGSGFIPGTLNDVMMGVYCDTTETMRVVKSILSNNYLDASVVHVFEKNSLKAPIIFSGIKWFAVETPGGALIHDRDLLCYERMGRIVDQDGNYFAYHVLQSVELPEWPANRNNLKRAYLSICYLYRQVSEHWVGCFVMGNYDPNGMCPQSITDLVMANYLLSVGNTLECAHARRFSKLMASGQAHSNKGLIDSRFCNLCRATPGIFRSALVPCMGCHKRICKRCRVGCTMFRLNVRTRKPEKEFFCRECVAMVTASAPKKKEKSSSDNDFATTPQGEWSPTSGSTSVRSDNNLRDFDVESLAELAQQWSVNDNNADGLVWNTEELQRVAGRLKSSRMPKSTDAQSRQRMQNPLSKTMINTSSKLGSSMFAAPLKRSKSKDDVMLSPGRRTFTSNVPGNSYHSSNTTWRERAARLNEGVSNPSANNFGASQFSGSRGPTGSHGPSSSNGPSRGQRHRPPSVSEEEMQHMYAQFQEHMNQHGGAEGYIYPGEEGYAQYTVMFDVDRGEYYRVPAQPEHFQHQQHHQHHQQHRPPSPRHDVFSIDELD